MRCSVSTRFSREPLLDDLFEFRDQREGSAHSGHVGNLTELMRNLDYRRRELLDALEADSSRLAASPRSPCNGRQSAIFAPIRHGYLITVG